MNNYLEDVRDQYERYPYPQRDPAEEYKQLRLTSLDQLPLINHFCFNGSKDFRTNFRVLVAGGGTGDAAIYLAEQLRGTDAEIIYLDMTAASLEIAQARAKIRKLDNIRWINDSILNIPRLQLGGFDYINCSGVLHHLESPDEGLHILQGALNEDGAMGVMVYAKYGRTGIYQMQELMRLINRKVSNAQIKVENTKSVLAELPDSNWFSMSKHLTSDYTRYGDIGIYDLFLHSRDRAYSVSELYEWLDAQRLKLVTFTADKYMYLPESFIRNPVLLNRIKESTIRNQQAIAEILCGHIMKHTFYCSKKDNTEASIEDGQMVPFLWGAKKSHANLHHELCSQAENGILVIEAGTIKLQIEVSELLLLILKHMDGVSTIADMAHRIGTALPTLSKTTIAEGIRQLYEILHFAGIAYLRQKTIPMYLNAIQLQNRSTALMGS